MAQKIELNRLLEAINSNLVAFLGKTINESVYPISEITRDIFLRSESVPEFKFNSDIFTLLCQLQIPIFHGFLTEEELKEVLSGSSEVPEVELFVNPPDLFLDGKIRPDLVFRKGVGKYVIFEIDSFLYHSSQLQLTKDKIRERAIQGLGYPVYRFSAKEVLQNSWDKAIEAVKILEKEGFISIPKKDGKGEND